MPCRTSRPSRPRPIKVEQFSGAVRARSSGARPRALALQRQAAEMALSDDPERESVLILAHGPGDDRENERSIAALDELAQPMRDELGFRTVEVHTLREDWDEKRKVAEAEIRVPLSVPLDSIRWRY